MTSDNPLQIFGSEFRWGSQTQTPRPLTAPRMLPSAHATTSALRSWPLEAAFNMACALAVYASQRGLPQMLRKTRFRWVAIPGRVFAPTRSTTKDFRFCLLYPSSLPGLPWRET